MRWWENALNGEVCNITLTVKKFHLLPGLIPWKNKSERKLPNSCQKWQVSPLQIHVDVCIMACNPNKDRVRTTASTSLWAVIIMQKMSHPLNSNRTSGWYFRTTVCSKNVLTSFFGLVFFVRIQEFPGQYEPLRQLHRRRALQIRCVGHSLSEDLWLHVLSVVREPPPTNRQVNTQAG